MRQSPKRKIKVWFHCLIHWHRRGVIPCANNTMTERWTKWVCADCAEKQFTTITSEPTPADIQWATNAIKAHPEWETLKQ